jgi:hypothetical protein
MKGTMSTAPCLETGKPFMGRGAGEPEPEGDEGIHEASWRLRSGFMRQVQGGGASVSASPISYASPCGSHLASCNL